MFEDADEESRLDVERNNNERTMDVTLQSSIRKD
jgi:hypothetical protein